EPLRAILARDRTVPLPRALELARQILVALDAAHQAGVVHRDVKPENVFVVATAAGTLVKLLDFGLARPPKLSAHELSLTGGGLLLGTLAYMAPEQARAERASPAVDVYAVGTILFEMIAGSRPYLGAGGDVLEAKVLGRPPRALAEVAPGAPPAVAALVGEMLAPVADRPRDAHAALARLARAVEAVPPPAPAAPEAAAPAEPPELAPRPRRAPPATRTKVAFVGALLATLLVGAGVLGGALAIGAHRSRAQPPAPRRALTADPEPDASALDDAPEVAEALQDAGGGDASRPIAPRSAAPSQRPAPPASDGASCYCRRGNAILCPTLQERRCRCIGAAGTLCRSKLTGTPARCAEGSYGFEHLAHGATCEGFARGLDLTHGRELASARHEGHVSCEVCTRTPPPTRAPPGATCTGYLFEDERLEGNWECGRKP
ncbi:MAG: protein kinase, partial [Myxococcales bacterium]|nr:protein kinase [Myxococcales bacterium]